MAIDRARLMERYCDGDTAAFRALYAAVAGRLLHFVTCIVGDRASGEDVLQRTFLKVHAARAAYVRGADPLPWIYTIANRVALDELRRRRRAHGVASPTEPTRATLSGIAEDAARDLEELQALSRRLLEALASLSPTQREALVLMKLHGRSSAEAAMITGASQSAVKVRSHRAFLALRRLLGGSRPAAPHET